MTHSPAAAWQRTAAILAAVIAASSLLAGCQDEPQVSTYEVARTRTPRRPIDLAAERARLSHMQVAILVDPDERQAWFFKLVAPGNRAAALQPQFEQLLKSVRFAAAEDANVAPTPQWDLPDGWTAQPGDANRFATLVVPDGDEQRELTITQLRYPGDRRVLLATNVNRWLNQLEEAPLPPERIEEMGRPVMTGGGEAMLFELIGVMAKTNAMPSGHPPVNGAAPPVAPPPATTSPGFRYETPTDWTLAAPRRMRRATFTIAVDEGQAEVAVSAYPGVAGQGMGDVLMNLRRWAGEVGATDLTPDELQALAQPRTVDGLDGTFAEVFGPADGDAPEATLAVLLPREQMIWFFKLRGDRAVVEQQRDAFAAFLESVRFE